MDPSLLVASPSPWCFRTRGEGEAMRDSAWFEVELSAKYVSGAF